MGKKTRPDEIELSPQETCLALARHFKKYERDILLSELFPEGVGPYEQERVVERIRRHFPEVPRDEIYGMNPAQLAVYLRRVLEVERRKKPDVVETKPGRPKNKFTKQRADFYKKWFEGKGLTPRDTFEKYQVDYPEDTEATSDIIRQAYNRNYPTS